MSFARLFPAADYRHHLSVKRGDLKRFFAPPESDHSVIAERNRWLDESPSLYSAAFESAAPMISETAELLGAPAVTPPADSVAAVTDLGRRIEPDIVLLEKAPDGVFRVVAGCVCFPSSWSFPEKLGMPLDVVHSVVPDLNNAIGAPIANFLGRIQPGASWERSNWGLSASPERNQHPARQLPRLSAPVALENVWLRVEDQILSLLPGTKALLFGIRILTCSLAELRRTEPDAAAGLHRTLATLPEPMARYKNIAQVRPALVELLAD